MTWQNQSVGDTTHTIVTGAGTATRTRAWPWWCALALPQCPCHHPPSKRILYGPSSLYHLLSIQSSKWVHPKHSSVFPFLAAEETKKASGNFELHSKKWNTPSTKTFFFLFYLFGCAWSQLQFVASSLRCAASFSCSMWSLSCGMWVLAPWPGIKPGSLALGVWTLNTGPPGKSLQPRFLDGKSPK